MLQDSSIIRQLCRLVRFRLASIAGNQGPEAAKWKKLKKNRINRKQLKGSQREFVTGLLEVKSES